MRTQNRYSAFADSDTESESEEESESINPDINNGKLIDRMIILLNLFPDAFERIKNGRDISQYQSQMLEMEDQLK